MSGAVQDGASDAEADQLRQHVPCANCEYDLFLQDIRSRCPECGEPISVSLTSERLRLMRGAPGRFLIAAVAVWVLYLAATPLLFPMRTVWLQLPRFLETIKFFELASLPAAVSLIVIAYLLTRFSWRRSLVAVAYLAAAYVVFFHQLDVRIHGRTAPPTSGFRLPDTAADLLLVLVLSGFHVLCAEFVAALGRPLRMRFQHAVAILWAVSVASATRYPAPAILSDVDWIVYILMASMAIPMYACLEVITTTTYSRWQYTRLNRPTVSAHPE